MVSCGLDGCVRVWDVRQEDQPVASFEPLKGSQVRHAFPRHRALLSKHKHMGSKHICYSQNSVPVHIIFTRSQATYTAASAYVAVCTAAVAGWLCTLQSPSTFLSTMTMLNSRSDSSWFGAFARHLPYPSMQMMAST